jgi:uncharacterized protein
MTTWDEAKRRDNIAKHGLDLADAERFDFEDAFYEDDWEREGEDRVRAIGWLGDRLCVLVYTVRDDEARAISLRVADKKEKRRYFKALSTTYRR